MTKTNQLLLFTCCLIILIAMVCMLREEPFISGETIVEALSTQPV